MNQWKNKKLSELCNIRYGKDYKKLSDGSIPVYGSGGIMRYVDAEIHNRESVLIPRKGTLSNLFLVKPPFWTVDTIFWTDIFLDQVDPTFLYYNLKTKNLEGLNVGSAVPSLTTAVLNEVLLFVPPLLEQKSIADTLSCLDEKIELNNKMNKNLEAQAQAIFKSWFVDFDPFQEGEFNDSELGMIPKGWRVGLLGEIANFYSGYSYKGSELQKSEYAMATIKNFDRKGGFKLNGFKEIIPSSTLKLSHEVELFDILVAHTDLTQNADVIGNAEMLLSKNGYKKIIASMDLVTVKSKNSLISSIMLHSILKHGNFKDHALGYVNGTTVLHLSKKSLPSYKITLPNDFNIYKKIGELLNPLYYLISRNTNEIQTLIKLRDTLLPKLMSGEIRVPYKEVD